MQLCGATPTFDGVVKTNQPHEDARQALEWLTRALGIAGNFTLLEGQFSKGYTAIAAMHSRHIGRFIVYDGSKFHWTPEDPDWDEVTILGHEIGHHLNGDTSFTRTHGRGSWARELLADQTAGFLVARLGGTLDQATNWFRGISPRGSESHPPRDDRIEAVSRGWYRADALKRWERSSCTTEWLSEPQQIGDETCRIVRHCGIDEAPRLACQDQLGDWIVRR